MYFVKVLLKLTLPIDVILFLFDNYLPIFFKSFFDLISDFLLQNKVMLCSLLLEVNLGC